MEERYEPRGEIDDFEYAVEGPDEIREDGTAHGCLGAILMKEEEGAPEDRTWWRLEQEPDGSNGYIRRDESTK